MALKDTAKLRLSIIFEGIEGQSETDYLVFHPSTDVGTALAIVRSHFMQKYYSSIPNQKKSKDFGLHKHKESISECVALWGYDAVEQDELTFRDGDVIGVCSKPHKV